MQNKNILLVGVNGGMGEATAKLLLENGYNVWGLDYSDNYNLPNLHFIKTDITDSTQINKAFEQVKQEAKSLYAIIHLAGIYMMDSLLEIDENRIKKIFDINVLGVYRINKTFLPLLSSGSRIIITTSELAPLDPLPFNGIYSITKSTLEKYAYSLRMETNLMGITVTVVRPGAVQTKLLNSSTSELDKFCDNTVIHQKTSKEFKKIINNVEAKSIPAEKIAHLMNKILTCKKPKYTYKINRNFLLLLLNALPQHLQVFIIKKILLKK